MSSLRQSPEVFMCFIYSITITASYFLEMSMLISLKGTLTQTRMGIGRVTLPSKGPMKGQFVFLITISKMFDRFCIQLLVFLKPRIAFPSTEPMRGQYLVLTAKSQCFYFYFQLLFLKTPRPISLKYLCL